jgi:dynein heavy chain, axonemal
MYYDFGGAPYGPAGTGKTETIKDLAKKIGRHAIVYNCSVNMHIQQVADLVTGVVACGYWSCFDEFNRIDLRVL